MSGDDVTSENAGPAKKSNDDKEKGHAESTNTIAIAPIVELDDFGLPIRPKKSRRPVADAEDGEGRDMPEQEPSSTESSSAYEDAIGTPAEPAEKSSGVKEKLEASKDGAKENGHEPSQGKHSRENSESKIDTKKASSGRTTPEPQDHKPTLSQDTTIRKSIIGASPEKHHGQAVSEWSHQVLVPQDQVPDTEEEEKWEAMPAYAPFDIYDDRGKIIAHEQDDSGDEKVEYGTLGGAGKGYTRVQLDEDVQSVTSMDDNTAYLFKETGTNVAEEDDDLRDALSQMQATKEMLTEGQRIAYVGIVRLAMVEMVKELEAVEKTRGTKKVQELIMELLQKWSQKMMVRIYSHMDVESAEQVMIEQLAEHGVIPSDLTPVLMQNARVKNPVAEEDVPALESSSSPRLSVSSPPPNTTTSRPPSRPLSVASPPPSAGLKPSDSTVSIRSSTSGGEIAPYDLHMENTEYPAVRTPSQLPDTKAIDIDIRWTVLCDLFLVLIADSLYDARSRQLLEKVGGYLDISWLEICRFEKRVTDALEMQEAASKENWNEDEHMESRRKMFKNRRLVMMGLATVGGGLVIGLSAGLLAPVIGAGLAAGFTTIGVAGTSGFLAGAGGAAIVTTTGVISGGTIAVRAANRRTGAVQTFEYRPLHNNKRVNLIVTISGWMNGKVDDVRLPFSTVDSIMGDIYSVYWEPEMLQSMGQTITILATEALTQTLQQVLGSTILVALMAALQLPVVLTKLAYLIDNPWTVSMARADLAGLILADSLIDRNLGSRPITLVGFSLGSRVIYACLRELVKKGQPGLIQNVYMFGSPVIANKDEFIRCKSVVAGRFVNGYATNDWILGYLFRATGGGIRKVAGLGPLDEVPGIENVNVSEWVPGHMSYRAAMPRLLREVGWIVESDEFTEIEDPDPDNHEERQRELINEIEEARKALEEKPEKKSKFGFFKRKKIAEKKAWETYDETSKIAPEGKERDSDYKNGSGEGVLFDVDAIKAEIAELAGHGIEIKQLESTLPPMKLNLDSSPQPLRPTKSFNDSITPSSPHSNGSLTQPSTADRPDFAKGISESDAHDGHSGGIYMTFGTSPPRALSGHMSPLHLGSNSGSAANISTPTYASDWDTVHRPALKSHATMPVPAPAPAAPPILNLEHNAWADEDEEYGKETEMKMTFE
ncbi:DUF726-domain-containing protein [Tothia fuscella]|uniref:DUF726-domain-containing protein n=1 Tax=Tothia fuscella TaxID=1048955 RepID=A0A9P4NH75_9PEZI|nr:DUF726-domain-containing protein [Tothia fuscella]